MKPTEIKHFISRYDDERRRPVAVSLGCHLVGAVLPHPDLTHRDTTLGGTKKRVLIKPPDVSKPTLHRMRKFARKWIKANLVPLPSDADTSVERWLEATNYTMARKVELLRLWRESGELVTSKHKLVKSFVKDEFYPEFKHPRTINSRDDVYKVAVGPTFKLIEQELFKLPWFIKKIPMDQRPEYIYQRVYREHRKYIVTDYTAFESHFTKSIMDAVEFELYRYMVKNLPNRKQFLDHISALQSKNTIIGSHFTYTVDATRMSGEMNTSLGNGFSNLMFMLFACEEVGAFNISGVIEGDDGLFVVDGPAPTSAVFKDMGLTIKLEMTESISTASFCGLIFDEQDKVFISNPVEDIQTFGWSDKKYSNASDAKLKQLLRSKSLSMLYQYRNAPIYQALARYGIRMTEGVRALGTSHFNTYERDHLNGAYSFYNRHSDVAHQAVPIRTRLLMEREFHISVESQLKIERYLDSLTSIQPLDLEFVRSITNSDSQNMYAAFVHYLPNRVFDLDKFIRT